MLLNVTVNVRGVPRGATVVVGAVVMLVVVEPLTAVDDEEGAAMLVVVLSPMVVFRADVTAEVVTEVVVVADVDSVDVIDVVTVAVVDAVAVLVSVAVDDAVTDAVVESVIDSDAVCVWVMSGGIAIVAPLPGVVTQICVACGADSFPIGGGIATSHQVKFVYAITESPKDVLGMANRLWSHSPMGASHAASLPQLGSMRTTAAGAGIEAVLFELFDPHCVGGVMLIEMFQPRIGRYRVEASVPLANLASCHRVDITVAMAYALLHSASPVSTVHAAPRYDAATGSVTAKGHG